MKTPRDLILQRHSEADAALRGIRADDLAALAAAQPSPTTDTGSVKTSLAQVIWLEVVAPWKRVWLGIGAAWLAIILLNNVSSEPSTTRVARSASVTPETVRVLQEQHRLMAQLLGPMEMPAIINRSANGPRSEIKVEFATV